MIAAATRITTTGRITSPAAASMSLSHRKISARAEHQRHADADAVDRGPRQRGRGLRRRVRRRLRLAPDQRSAGGRDHEREHDLVRQKPHAPGAQQQHAGEREKAHPGRHQPRVAPRQQPREDRLLRPVGRDQQPPDGVQRNPHATRDQREHERRRGSAAGRSPAAPRTRRRRRRGSPSPGSGAAAAIGVASLTRKDPPKAARDRSPRAPRERRSRTGRRGHRAGRAGTARRARWSPGPPRGAYGRHCRRLTRSSSRDRSGGVRPRPRALTTSSRRDEPRTGSSMLMSAPSPTRRGRSAAPTPICASVATHTPCGTRTRASPNPTRTLSCVRPAGSSRLRRSRSIWPMPSRYSGRRSATVVGRYSRWPTPPRRSRSAAETTASGTTSTMAGRMSHRGPPSNPAAIRPSPATIEITATATPPPSAATKPTPTDTANAATRQRPTSVIRAATRAGSSPRWPPKARYRPTPSSVKPATTIRPGAEQERRRLQRGHAGDHQRADDGEGGYARLVRDPGGLDHRHAAGTRPARGRRRRRSHRRRPTP